MKKFLFALLLSTSICATAQEFSDWFAPSNNNVAVTPFPIDPAIHYGKLDNGLTYYVLRNNIPEGTAGFYLLTRVGSILEEDDQRGFSYFIEEISRFGTKSLPGESMWDFFQRSGIRTDQAFSYATFDESAFQLYEVPLPGPRSLVIDTCLTILHDWSACMTFDEEVMDKARKRVDVARNEYKRPVHRMFENTILPKLMSETTYAQRHPVGDKKTVDNCTPEQLQKYYDKWYKRPDLQAVIVVGDIDASYVERRIKEIWADVEAPVNPAPRTYQKINENSRPLVAVASDKEYDQNMIRFGTKFGKITPTQRNSQVGFTRALIRDVQAAAFEQRLNKVMSDKNSALISVNAEIDDYLVCKSMRTMNFTLVYKENRWQEALKYVMGLVADIYNRGYTNEEIATAKEIIRRNVEATYNERKSHSNRYLADKMRDNFLESKPLLDLELQYHLTTQMLDILPKEAYDEIFRQLVDSRRSQYIFCIGQDRSDIKLPTEKQLRTAFEDYLNQARKQPSKK